MNKWKNLQPNEKTDRKTANAMIDVRNIMLGDWLQNTNGNVGKVEAVQKYHNTNPFHSDYDVVMKYHENSDCYTDPKMLEPIPITTEILEKNGWKSPDGVIWYKKGPLRLGWYPKNKELIVGYHTLPMAVEFVHSLQNLMRDFGLEDDITL